MGTRGVSTTTNGKRIFALAFLCVAIPALFTSSGPLCATDDPPAPGALTPISLDREVLTNDKGDITGIRITGTVNVPPEVRRQKVYINIYYNDFVDSTGALIPTNGGGYAKIADDGSFKWEYMFPAGYIVNNGYWSAKAVIGQPAAGSVLAAGEIKQFLVGSEQVRDEQMAAERLWLLRLADIYKEMRQRAIARHDSLKAAGFHDENFRDSRTEEEDFQLLLDAGLLPANFAQLIAPRKELPSAVGEFLRYVHSEDGHKALAAAGAAMKIQPMSYYNARADLLRVSINIHPPADVPAFAPFAPTVDPRASVKIVTQNSLKPVLDELGKSFKAVYPASSANASVTDGAGLVKAMQDKTADLLIIDRPFTAKELADIASKRGLEPVAIRVDSLGSLAIVVNAANPIAGLSVEEIDAIFSSTRKAGHSEDIATWGQAGVLDPALKDKPIKLVATAADKPESALFRDHVMLGGTMKPGVSLVPDAAAVITAVKADPAAIGFCRIDDLAADVRAVPVSARQWGEFVDATPDNVTAGAYPLTCYIYAYVIYDVSWGVWGPELIQETIGRVDDIRKYCPKMVIDTVREPKQHLDEMVGQLQIVLDKLRRDLMGVNRVTELWIKGGVAKVRAEKNVSPAEARKKVLADNGGLDAMRAIVQGNLPKELAKAHRGFNDTMNPILVQLQFTQNVTVATLYSDLSALCGFYWGLCDGYQDGLKQFAPQAGAVWQAVLLEKITVFKKQADKYVPNDEAARNIGRDHKEIKDTMGRCVDELLKLRLALLKDLHAKHQLPPPADVPRDLASIDEYARSFKRNYDALARIVQDEKQKYLPPLTQSLAALREKFTALNDYMTPFMPGRAAPPADLPTWVDAWSDDMHKELEAASARLADRNFTDVFFEAAQAIRTCIMQMTGLRDLCVKAATQNDAAAAKRAALLKDAISKRLDEIGKMIEGRFDIENEDKQIHLPGEQAYSDRYKPPAP